MNNTAYKRYIYLLVSVQLSYLGTQISDFALGVWLLQETGAITLFSILGFVTLAPQLLLSPFIGVIVDRFNPKKLILLGHTGAGLATVTLAILYHFDKLSPLPLIILVALSSVFNGLLLTAFNSATVALVNKNRLTKVQGLIQGANAFIMIASPTVAAVVYTQFDLNVIFMLDIVSFVVAIALLGFLSAKAFKRQKSAPAKLNVKSDLHEAWRYLHCAPKLFTLVMLMAVLNALMGIITALITPMVLGFSDAEHLGYVRTAAGLGALAGGLMLYRKKAPFDHVGWLLRFNLLVACTLFLMAFKLSIGLLIFSACVLLFGRICAAGCFNAYWQIKVPLDLQGRLMSFRLLFSNMMYPIGFLIAGPVADLLQPTMMPGGIFADYFGGLLGVGPTRGIALFAYVIGVILLLAVFITASKVSSKIMVWPALKRPVGERS